MTPTVYFDDFLAYYRKAERLQAMNLASPTGRDVLIQQVGDPLMDYVTIYDCVERRYAGFSNALQQIWLGSWNDKQWQVDSRFDDAHRRFTELEWLWIFLVHRVTGSGASFAADHGFRNSVVGEMALAADQAGDMKRWLLKTMLSGRPVFTSIGNQPPAFPKPQHGYKRASEYYFDTFAPRLCWDMLNWLREQPGPVGIKTAVRHALDLQTSYGLKRYHFVLTAWIMDLGEYFPQYVDPFSHVGYGKNALAAFNLMFEDFTDKKAEDAMETIQTAIGEVTRPYSLEDVACDAIRYWGCYVPKGYEHLKLWQVTNRSAVEYPKHASYARHAAMCAVRDASEVQEESALQ